MWEVAKDFMMWKILFYYICVEQEIVLKRRNPVKVQFKCNFFSVQNDSHS